MICHLFQNFFKDYELLSVKKNQVYKILTSSGTTGSKSKIFLDRNNAKEQIKVLQRLVSKILGNRRLPMVVVDKEDIIKQILILQEQRLLLVFLYLQKKNYFYLIKNSNLIKINLKNF